MCIRPCQQYDRNACVPMRSSYLRIFTPYRGRFPQREALALDRHGSALDRSSDRFTIFNKAWDIFESIDSVSHTIDLSHHR